MANSKFVVSAMGKRVDFDALAAGTPKRTRQEIKAGEKTSVPKEISGHRPAPAPHDDYASLVTVIVEHPKDKDKEPRGKKAQAE